MREIRPSGADTWTVCYGQPAYVESLNLVEEPKFYADEGTAAHEIASDCLQENESTSNVRLGDMIATDSGDIEVTMEMVDAVDAYLIEIYKSAEDKNLIVEKKIDCSDVLGKGRTGTGDAIIVPSEETTLEIHDYKHGKGVEVFARRNKQMMIYGAAFILSNPFLGPFDKVKLTIHQPRIKEAPDSWTMSVEKLMKFAKFARKMASKADNIIIPGEGLVPGEKQCFWCPGKATCPAIHEQIASVFDDIDPLFDQVNLPDDSEDLAERYEKVKLVQMWCKAVLAAGFNELDRGGDLPGYKLIEGRRGDKKWKDKRRAVKALTSMRLRKDQMYESALKSPTKIFKLLSAPRIEKLKRAELIEQSPGKPTVAKADDPREQILRKPVFDDLDNGNHLSNHGLDDGINY